MAFQAAFTEEVAGLQDCNDCFLALFGQDSELDLASLNVKHCVRYVALREHVFILPEFQYRFPRAHLGKKPQGVERVFRWFRHCSVLFSASFGRGATLACLASSFKFYF
jgi:hypothetical protein